MTAAAAAQLLRDRHHYIPPLRLRRQYERLRQRRLDNVRQLVRVGRFRHIPTIDRALRCTTWHAGRIALNANRAFSILVRVHRPSLFVFNSRRLHTAAEFRNVARVREGVRNEEHSRSPSGHVVAERLELHEVQQAGRSALRATFLAKRGCAAGAGASGTRGYPPTRIIMPHRLPLCMMVAHSAHLWGVTNPAVADGSRRNAHQSRDAGGVTVAEVLLLSSPTPPAPSEPSSRQRPVPPLWLSATSPASASRAPPQQSAETGTARL